MPQLPILIALALAVGTAPRDSRLSHAIAVYEGAEFAAARDLLLELIDAPDLPLAERAEARSYAAAAYLALGDPASARLQLRALARERPEARPSPATFPPELLKIAAEVWEDAERRRLPTHPPAVVRGPDRALAFIPFGVGQFARGDPAAGAVFLGAEVGFLGASTALLLWLESLKLPDQPHQFLVSGSVDPAHAGIARALNVAYPACLFTAVAAMVAGVAEANVRWPVAGVAVVIAGPGAGIEVRF